jgi:hypothetical protein
MKARDIIAVIIIVIFFILGLLAWAAFKFRRVLRQAVRDSAAGARPDIVDEEGGEAGVAEAKAAE